MGFLLSLILVQELAHAESFQTTRDLEQQLNEIQKALAESDAENSVARDEAVREVTSAFDVKMDKSALSIVSAIDKLTDKLTLAIAVQKDERANALEVQRAYLDIFSDLMTGVVGPLIGLIWLGSKTEAGKKLLRWRNGPKE